MIRHSSIADEMFSVENLKRLATSKLPDLTRQADLSPDIGPAETLQYTTSDANMWQDIGYAQSSNIPCEANRLTDRGQETNPPVASANVIASAANGHIEEGKFVIPIEISGKDLGLSSDLSAKLSIRVNVDLDKLIAALRIQDETKRLETTRKIIQMSEPQCELTFDP